MYGRAAMVNKKSRLAAIEKRKDIMTKIKTCEAQKREKWIKTFMQEIRSMTEHRQRFNVELENFQKVLPELNERITESLKHLKKFETRLQEHSIDGWSYYDVKLDEGLSAKDRVKQSVQYLQQMCVSQKWLGKFGKEYLKAKQILSATCIQKWYRPKYRRWIKAAIKAAIRIQALGRGYNARKQKKCIRGEIATNGSPEPSKEIETPPGTPVGTPVGTPETLETPPQKQPEQSTAPVVVVSPVSKPRTSTRAVAPVTKHSAEDDWDVAVLSAFVADVLVLVFYVIYY
jgi:hypothetical protein